MARLLNVRLDEARWRKVRKLRERGVLMSEVVRKAVDEQYAAAYESPTEESAAAILDAIFGRWPDPPDLPARTYDVHDRRAARAAIVARARRRRA